MYVEVKFNEYLDEEYKFTRYIKTQTDLNG